MLDKLVKSLVNYCNKGLVFQKPPRLFLKQDQTNSTNALGKTAHYQPGERIVTVYISGRHPKDILRSIAHELVHHHQNERGDFDGCAPTEDGYAQSDEHLRNMEKEAYLKGNMLFRDWEDSCKKQMQMEDKNKMKLSELKKIIKETIESVVKEGVRGSFIGDDDPDWAKYTTPHDGPKSYRDMDHGEKPKGPGADLPKMLTPAQKKRKEQLRDDCIGETGKHWLSDEVSSCIKDKIANSLSDRMLFGLSEEKIEEGDCGSGKREDEDDKAVKEGEELEINEGSAYLEPSVRTRFLSNPTKEMAAQKKHIMQDPSMVEPSVDKYLKVLMELLEKTAGQSTVTPSEAQRFFELRGGEFGNPNSFAGPDSGVSVNPNYKEPKPYGWQRDLEKDKMNRFEESKVMTVEKEKALKENYMGEKRNRLFEKLTKKWTK